MCGQPPAFHASHAAVLEGYPGRADGGRQDASHPCRQQHFLVPVGRGGHAACHCEHADHNQEQPGQQ